MQDLFIMTRVRTTLTAALLSAAGWGVADSHTLSAQSVDDRWALHGYFTQAYAKSDRYQTNGITKEGTSNYRIIALQTRYAVTDNDRVVVQVRSRQSGVSLVNDDGIALDWAYYIHDFGHVDVKIGKTPIPLGLYNETRLVGTLLPFYRAPSAFYAEGVETIAGMTVSGRMPLGAWSLDATVYGGAQNLTFITATPAGPFATRSNTENTTGAQLWLNTPITGLRVGGSYMRFQAILPTLTGPDTSRNKLNVLSFDWTQERMFLRGEREWYSVQGVYNGVADHIRAIYYGQAGVNVVGPLSLNAQVEYQDENAAGFQYRSLRDQAVGVSYRFSTDMVAKLEAHAVKGYAFETYVSPLDPVGKTNYGIASMSVSF